MRAAKNQQRDLVIRVRRDSAGGVYSEVADRNKPNPWGGYDSVVIDRMSRRLDIATIERRAELLRDLLGIPLDVDLTWHCVAARKMPCRCPKCIESGKA